MKKILSFGIISLLFFSLSAQSVDWASVAAPEIKSIALTEGNPNEISVEFLAATDAKSASKGEVIMTSPYGEKVSNPFGKTRKALKHSEFVPAYSGKYTFVVVTERNGQKEKKSSAPVSFDFTLPLEKPVVTILNVGNCELSLTWNAIVEAEGYVVSYTDAGKKIDMPLTKGLSASIKGLKDGDYSDITVSAVRGSDSAVSKPIHKLVRAEKERVWKFTEFGTSTNPERNRYEVLDPNDLKVKLYSCTYDEKTGNIIEKGGKFESFFDGISFYYTTIDPYKYLFTKFLE